jgi:hypothetical protein
MKFSKVFKFLALVYSKSPIFLKGKKELFITSVSKVLAPGKNAIFAAGPLYLLCPL